MKSFIIPLFIPHEGCPHQCVFCNQTNITGQTKPVAAAAVAATIAAGLDRLTQKRRVEVAFYGGSFTALPLSLQAKLLQPAYLALQSGLTAFVCQPGLTACRGVFLICCDGLA